MNNGPINNYPFTLKVPEGDDRERHVCGDCGWINYINPKIVAGAVITHGDKFLICRRAIEPRVGYWTIPAGYLEAGEAPDEGAMREAEEEANAKIEIDALLAMYSIKRISQIHMMYRARLLDPNVSAGEESLEVAMVTWDEIPWQDLAFPTITWAFNHYREVVDQISFQPFTNPADSDLAVR